MIKLNLKEVFDKVIELRNMGHDLPVEEFDRAVRVVAEPMAEKLRAEYLKQYGTSDSSDRYQKKSQKKLAESVQVYRRNRKALDPYFTYFIGARWGYGGNTAYLMEYGSLKSFIRVRTNKKKGGYSTKINNKREFFGETLNTGHMPAFGIIRRTSDHNKEVALSEIKANVLKVIIDIWKKGKK